MSEVIFLNLAENIPTSSALAVHWFRRDLRLTDNVSLQALGTKNCPILPLFIFDSDIISSLPKNDARIEFIYNALLSIHKELLTKESGVLIALGKPRAVFEALTTTLNINYVYTNHDYEPYAVERDSAIASLLQEKGIEFTTFKDQVLFEKDEVLSQQGKPYTVYTPYSKAWRKKAEQVLPQLFSEKDAGLEFAKGITTDFPILSAIGFQESGLHFPPSAFKQDVIQRYDKQRDFPALDATSRLGVHLRFGTVGVRSCITTASKLNDTWLSELIWREFFMQVLWHYPHSATSAFRSEYNNIPWRNNSEDFERWCTGTTGYPIVDAGMRELVQTGYMHNRVRMITASFLCKHLLIDWRWGERFFARHLLDFDLSANVGNWQWAAGTGCDAAPYFRVFNPQTQTEKFDPKGEYIRRWVPEVATFSYPQPMIEHSYARERALQTYKLGLGKS